MPDEITPEKDARARSYGQLCGVSILEMRCLYPEIFVDVECTSRCCSSKAKVAFVSDCYKA
jgi:hypothetical protein